MIEITCQHCGKIFHVRNYRANTARYCSKSCLASSKTGIRHPRFKGGPVTLSCRNCGKEYQAPYFERNRSHFCSKTCGNSFNQRGEKSHLWQGGPITFTCEVCNKVVIRQRGKNPKGNYRFCSCICSGIGRRTLIKHVCPGCSKLFMVHPSWLEKGRNYCSISCYRHNRVRPNTIEKAIQDGLRARGIEFIPEYPVGRLHVDIYIPAGRIAIECNGDYWHKGREEIDARRADRLRAKGFTVIHFTESEIRQSPEECVSRILHLIP